MQLLRVAIWIEAEARDLSALTVTQRLAALRHLFDWLITGYLWDGGTQENAAAMANHASTRTTQLHDRRRDDISLDEVGRIRV